MGWLPDGQFTDVHIIRRDVARAKAASEAAPGDEGLAAAYAGQLERRARAIRMIARETESTPRHLAAMFKTTKTAVRAALEAGEE